MSDNSKIALGVAGGYLLGRTKKMKLALSLGGLLIGQKIPTNPRELLKQGQKLVQGNEDLSQIDEMVRGKLLEAARAAALATLSSRMNSVSDSIRERTGGLESLPTSSRGRPTTPRMTSRTRGRKTTRSPRTSTRTKSRTKSRTRTTAGSLRPRTRGRARGRAGRARGRAGRARESRRARGRAGRARGRAGRARGRAGRARGRAGRARGRAGRA